MHRAPSLHARNPVFNRPLSSIACLLIWLALPLASAGPVRGQDRAPTNYLDPVCDPYYPHAGFPKLITPQWVGEEGVDAVITLGIDDMRDTMRYETYLRPILERLKKIDGRAAVSIMTCRVNPEDPQLQQWLKEGLSIETHTFDHPCPLLGGNDFAKAKSTYDRCVDLMASIPGNKPVAFRFPCCDSLNTPSPRAFAEIVNRATPKGRFLQASSSVVCIFTPRDTELPARLTTLPDGKGRFERYIPFPSFVNKIENYPYPYVIDRGCWEFPIMVPDDWQGQNLQRPSNPKTVDDMIAAIDATVLKKGVANLVFHPHGWIRSDEIVRIIDHVQKTYGKRVKFLTFKECLERINRSLLLGQPVRAAKGGGDNGVRFVDVNHDGYLDVLIGNEHRKTVRVWQPAKRQWKDSPSPLQLTAEGEAGVRSDLGVRFGYLTRDRSLCAFVNNEQTQGIYRFEGDSFQRQELPEPLRSVRASAAGVDLGVRLRDLNGDGLSEILVGGEQRRMLTLSKEGQWTAHPHGLPSAIVDARGRDNGVRLVDLDKDGFEDWVVSNDEASRIHLYDATTGGFTKRVKGLKSVPKITSNGANNGAWFAKDHLWLQNEQTNRLPDGVDRRTFQQLLGDTEPGPRTPQQGLKSLQVRPGFEVELIASEPMVMDPIALDWGPDGKLWVVEMADYPLGLDDHGKPGGRVRFLEDTNGDGKYDKSTLFLDGLSYPSGVMAWRDGVLVSAAPHVFFAKDSTGDGKADTRNVLYRGFGEGNQQHRVNGFMLGLDNWVYLANGDSGGVIESLKTKQRIDIRGRDLRIRPDDGALEAQTGQTQFGRHRDDHGNWFGSSNPLPVRHYVLADHYLRRNPWLAAPSSRRDIARGDNSRLYPLAPVMSHWVGYKPPAPGQPHRFTSACSTQVYRDNLFGPEFKQNTFTCAPVHNAVHRRRLIPGGVSFESKRPDDEPDFEFLASTDSWFRPTTVTTGPDGALWITDMYRLVIEHPEWIDDRREKELFLRAGHDRGRIYRVFPKGRRPRPIERLDQRSAAELVRALDSPNGRQRDLAQRLLVQRRDATAAPLLVNMANSAKEPLARLHAICTLEGLGEVSQATLLRALEDQHATVRRHAVRIAETALKNGENAELLSRLDALVKDSSPLVRLQLAYSLGFSRDERATAALAKLAVRDHRDPYIRAAVLSSLNKENLSGFYAAIASRPSTAKTLRNVLFQMAGRMRDRKVASSIISSLVMSIRPEELSTSDLDELNEALGVFKPDGDLETPQVAKRLKGISRSAMVILQSESKSATKAAAIRFIAATSHEGELTHLMRFINSRQPIEVQRAVVESLHRIKSETHVRALLKRLPELSPTIRTLILDEVLSREDSTRVLLAALDHGELKPQSIGLVHRQGLLNHAKPELRDIAGGVFGSPTTAEAKAKLLKQYSATVSTIDLEKGRQTFAKKCASCHRLDGVGHVVGPDLLSLKNRSSVALLTALLDPNQAVEDKFRSYSVQLKDGRTESGVIVDENSNGITLLKQEAKRVVILRNDIDEIRSLGKSLMPEGMEKEVSPVEMSHLLAYVQQARPPAKSFPGNEPALVKASDDGVIDLSATKCRVYGPAIVFETKYKNLGFWSSSQARAEWTLEIAKPGEYEIWLDYACPEQAAGNVVSFSIDGQSLTAKIAGTGSWDTYRQTRIGKLRLERATALATVTASGQLRAGSFLFDLRGVRLKPAK